MTEDAEDVPLEMKGLVLTPVSDGSVELNFQVANGKQLVDVALPPTHPLHYQTQFVYWCIKGMIDQGNTGVPTDGVLYEDPAE